MNKRKNDFDPSDTGLPFGLTRRDLLMIGIGLLLALGGYGFLEILFD
jgi:hypothetical protein